MEPLVARDPPLATAMHEAWVSLTTRGDYRWSKYGRARSAAPNLEVSSSQIHGGHVPVEQP
jgi:hypothetical protein